MTGQSGRSRPAKALGPLEPRHYAGHLHIALVAHIERLRLNRLPVPDQLVWLANTYGALAKGGAGIATHGDAMPETPAQLLTVGQVAAALNVSERTVRRRIADGALSSAQVGRAQRVHVDDLDAYVSSLRGPGAARSGQERSRLATPGGSGDGAAHADTNTDGRAA